MAKKASIISPVSIDLGAKYTGVYYAHYQAGAEPKDIKKHGKVYCLDKGKFTLLMDKRTASRHQRRGIDRRQMAKRLFKIIWEQHLEFPWNKDIEQTIGFLMNRRGFSFLTEEYDSEKLDSFPNELYAELPRKLREILENCGGEGAKLSDKLVELTRGGKEKIKGYYKEFDEKPLEIRRKLKVISDAKKLKKACEEKGKNTPTKKDIFVSEWILKKWQDAGIKGLQNCVCKDKGQANITKFSKEITSKDAKLIEESIEKFLENNSEKELKAKLWYIDLTKPFRSSSEEGTQLKEYLWHLGFALYKIYTELESGGRYRSKYFAEIKTVLEDESHKENYLKNFCASLHKGEYTGLDVDRLTQLLGHVSNLEIKPLRKYFNDKKHQNSDYWNEKKMRVIFEKWILKNWCVGEKDKLKSKGGQEDYGKLKEMWGKHKELNKPVVDFWLETEPRYTIPPYQNNNNRRPPKCQSLIFNVEYLKEHYQNWQKWLNALKDTLTLELKDEYLEGFQEELASLKSSKGNAYFGNSLTGENGKDSCKRTLDDLDARTLQFVFDRVKDNDPFKLNEIYSHAKKLRQLQSRDARLDKESERKKEFEDIQGKLKGTIQQSSLPQELKTEINLQSDDLFKEGTFLHLICKYYKLRRRARDGRIFIHPEYKDHRDIERGYEDTGRFDNNLHLLTYCNHKPRQKKYQLLYDIAGILEIVPKELQAIVINGSSEKRRNEKDIEKEIEEWLRQLKVESVAQKSAGAQKELRGALKANIQYVYAKKSNNKAISKDLEELFKLCENAKKKHLKMAEAIGGETAYQELERSLEANPARAVYFLAQLYNIAYKDRNGNAKTCPVCSTDNAQRMQRQTIDSSVKAQRLPAIEMRIIDGAVMRLARIVGGAIAERKWEDIKGTLEKDEKVSVPIVIEANRFEFEPSLRDLKGSLGKGPNEKEKHAFIGKDERIKQAGFGICPYTGDKITKDGEKDHIIPRSSKKWGEINDEANLIWASLKGNAEKGDEERSLKTLNAGYLERQFATSNVNDIEKFIVEQLTGEDEKKLKINYRSFLNLTLDEQKAFRHALFLSQAHPLREQVIMAMNNRTRTFVNGTQRYFASKIANSLYRRAKKINKCNLISFDYIEIQAWDNTRGQGIQDMRESLVRHRADLEKYNKEDGKSQKLYSHLLDAQIAFCMALDLHQEDGSLGIKLQSRGMGLWSRSRETNDDTKRNAEQYGASLFNALEVSGNDVVEELKRCSPRDSETHWRERTIKANNVSYQIHRDSLIAEKFIPLIQMPDETIRLGFTKENSIDYKKTDFDTIKSFLRRSKHDDSVWLVDRKKSFSFLMEGGRKGMDKSEREQAKLLDGLTYQMMKKPVEKMLEAKTIAEALKNWDSFIKKEKFTIKKDIVLPAYASWQKLRGELQGMPPDKNLQEALEECESFVRHNDEFEKHHKARKVFSLPVWSNIGTVRLRRRSWSNQHTIQLVAEEAFAKYDENERPHTLLSKNSIPRKHYDGIPKNWPAIRQEDLHFSDKFIKDYNEKSGIEISSAVVSYKEAKRSFVTLVVSSLDFNKLPLPSSIQEEEYCKMRLFKSRDKLKEQSTEQEQTKIYIGEDSKWFHKPFHNFRDDSEIEIKKEKNGHSLKFVVASTYLKFKKEHEKYE